MKAYPSSDGIYVCAVWNHVDCRNTRDYNTQVITKIKRENASQPPSGYIFET
jgi:hypothetical protein